MATTSEARWFQFIFVTAALLTASISLPHGQSGTDDRDIDQDSSDHPMPQTRDTTGDDGGEHESIVFIDGGKARYISKFDSTVATNIDEEGLQPDAHAGDILGEEFMTESDKFSKRKAVLFQQYIWPEGIIPWYFDSSREFQNQTSRDKIWDAIYHWQNLTCLRFPYRNTDSNYLKIGTGTGCASYIGRQGFPQPIYLLENKGGGTCLTRGLIAHEIGHAVGFLHEHMRIDRDNFVEILWDNILDGNGDNFKSYNITSLAVEYDLESVMHYGLKTFSKNGQPTIRTKREELSFLPGSRHGLTFYDAKMANIVYNCKGDCNNTCHNHGYPFKTPDEECVCNCPSYLTGDCNALDSATTDCGGVYGLNTAYSTITIESPNFPNNYDLNKVCVYVFKAPETPGSGVQLTFTDFDVTGSPDKCDHFVQINANLIGQKGVKYCGSFGDLPQGVSTFLDHNSTEMMVIFNTKNTTAGANKGFKFTAKVVGAIDDQISCTFNDGHLCGWKQATDDDFDWTPHSGSTPTKGTGPSGGDHDTPYIYADVFEPVRKRVKTTIYTDYFATGEYSFSFKWHMFGTPRMGTLQLSMVTKSGSETVLFRKSGNPDNAWLSSEQNFTATEESKLVFTGTKRGSRKGDIALDTFVMKKRGDYRLVLSCDFENDSLCSYSTDQRGYNWLTAEHPTPTLWTGPYSAYKGRFYIYAEASWIARGAATRLLLGRKNSTTLAKPFCLTFAYNMHGCHMGSLRVRLVNSNGDMGHLIWSAQGNKLYRWRTAKVHVDRTDTVQVAFEAIRGWGSRSDIALDFIRIHTASSCP